MKIKELAKKNIQYVIDMRREFHMHPEPGWKEERTSKRIKEELEKIGIPFVSAAGTGVIGTIKGNKKGKTIALRTDIDALEVNEMNDVAYRSQNEGISHACGHDAHMAMLLGAAKILNEIKDEVNGTVRLIFQPAEESLNGATGIIDDGGLDGLDGIFGMHITPMQPVGKVATGAGARMSSADFFNIDVKGKGGHGGMPDMSVDAVVVASSIVMNLQSIVSREIRPIEPVVVTVGVFNAGTRFNVIAGTASLKGTTRCYDDTIRKKLPEIMERIIKNTASSYRAEAELKYIEGVPALVNDAVCTERAKTVIDKILGKDVFIDMPPITGAEDFSYYLKKVPGVFVFLGAGNGKKDTMYPPHHERFNIDEDALESGTILHTQYAIDFLNEK